jgi:hypothetical protein
MPLSAPSHRLADLWFCGWHAQLMTSKSERGLLEHVVNKVVGGAAEVEWVEPGDSWSAHARLRGPSGRVSHVLTSPEWQEARFEESRCSVFILTSTDEDEVHEALAKPARAAVEYSTGGGHVEQKKGILGTGRTRVALAPRRNE